MKVEFMDSGIIPSFRIARAALVTSSPTMC